MRGASIRGQIRWWHRKAEISLSCNQVWGQTEPSLIASKVGLSLAPALPSPHKEVAILPHKQSGIRDALLPSIAYVITLTRLVGCGTPEWEAANKAVKLWLLLGGIGLRVNRAAGSVWPLGGWVPDDEARLRDTLNTLGYTHPVRLADSSLAASPQELRKAASDTVNGSPHLFGGIHPRRKPSPLKMKVIRLGSTHRLLLTGLDVSGMDSARLALAGKDLGKAKWHTV
jgi:hypothetical protein